MKRVLLSFPFLFLIIALLFGQVMFMTLNKRYHGSLFLRDVFS
jgi:hypothetical protein